MTNSRYCIGIDLGTSTCSLSWADTLDLSAGVRVFKIRQWIDERSVAPADFLPSFVYLPPKTSWKKGQLTLPELKSETQVSPPSYALGDYAKKQVVKTPDRVIHSAKSWLCHHGVNAEDPFLPWHSELLEGNEKQSPVEATALYLKHLKDLWDAGPGAHGQAEQFCAQQIVVTVPASFSELASRLTLKAIELAGYPMDQVRLLEEPQAAFYHWRYSTGLKSLSGGCERWEDLTTASAKQLQSSFKTDQVSLEPTIILVCDMGGGTTDFSLLSIKQTSKETLPEPQRYAVSDHILLGGDNIDLRIAKLLEADMMDQTKTRLEPSRWAALVQESRKLKEKVLNEGHQGLPEDTFYVSIPGSGSSLMSSGLSASLSRQQIKDEILEGFFPFCERNATSELEASGGLKEWGLPYAFDCRVTYHLAEFLAGQRVDGVLFTGGSLKPDFLQYRILDLLQKWQGTRPVHLENHSMDLAVSKGATWSALASRFKSGEILGGYPRNLYIEVAQQTGDNVLVCIVPKGFQSDSPFVLDQLKLKVRLGEPVSFKVYSSVKKSGIAGEIISGWSQDKDIKSLANLQTRLKIDKKGSARTKSETNILLEVQLGKTGLLSLTCLNDSPDQGSESHRQRWNLNFNVRASSISSDKDDTQTGALTGQDSDQVTQESTEKQIGLYYGKPKKGEKIPGTPAKLIRELETIYNTNKDQWSLSQLRSLWGPLKDGETRKGRSELHEATWLNLSGYALRPGYGDELDDFRTSDLWESFKKGMSHPGSAQVKTQWWIMWRRIAGGLNREQQELIFGKIFPAIRKDEATPEMYLLAGSLERISMNQKVRLGQVLTESLTRKKASCAEQKLIALSRIASRVPLYGGPEAIMKPERVTLWAKTLKELPAQSQARKTMRYFYSQAGRIINNRELDLDDQSRKEFLKELTKLNAEPELTEVVERYVPMDHKSQQRLFGEKLPAGFTLMTE